MLCSKCGAEIADNSKFCTKCGNKVERPESIVKEEPVKEEPAKVEPVKEEPSKSICSGCGQELLPGARFCTKCGKKQEAAAPVQPETPKMQPAQPAQPVKPAQPVQAVQAAKPAQPAQQAQPVKPAQPAQPVKPAQQAQTAQAAKPAQQAQATKPAQQAKAAKPAKKKSSNTGMIVMMVIILLLLLVVGGVGAFMVMKMDINPIAAISERLGIDDSIIEEDPDDSDQEDVSKNDVTAADAEKGDVKLLETGDELARKAEEEFQAENYIEGAIPGCADAIQEYMKVAEQNNLHDEAQEKIATVYEVYVDAIRDYCDTITAQGANAAGYEQISNTLSDAIELTDELSAKEYDVDSSILTTYKEDMIQTYKDMFIKSINGITEYENWSRDEAWNYAEAAYSIKENGKSVLFDDSDLEDPLRMRYVYSLAWITTKRCEKGLADGTMTNTDVVNNMDAILAETDYSPLLLYQIIQYGTAAGINVDQYQNAYQAIVDKIKSEQGLTVGTDISVSSATTVDIRHFWYFNDLDGEDRYKVDTHNGTTKATREWIRENIPGMLENE